MDARRLRSTWSVTWWITGSVSNGVALNLQSAAAAPFTSAADHSATALAGRPAHRLQA